MEKKTIMPSETSSVLHRHYHLSFWTDEPLWHPSFGPLCYILVASWRLHCIFVILTDAVFQSSGFLLLSQIAMAWVWQLSTSYTRHNSSSACTITPPTTWRTTRRTRTNVPEHPNGVIWYGVGGTGGPELFRKRLCHKSTRWLWLWFLHFRSGSPTLDKARHCFWCCTQKTYQEHLTQ